MQEVFAPKAMTALVSSVGNSFPHIVYDVGVYSWRCNKFLMNSGLFFGLLVHTDVTAAYLQLATHSQPISIDGSRFSSFFRSARCRRICEQRRPGGQSTAVVGQTHGWLHLQHTRSGPAPQLFKRNNKLKFWSVGGRAARDPRVPLCAVGRHPHVCGRFCVAKPCLRGDMPGFFVSVLDQSKSHQHHHHHHHNLHATVSRSHGRL